MNQQACSCGCVTQPCGCCDGVQQLTPASEFNRPGLPALSYRVGTHARFFESMKARIATISVDGVGADGQTVETFRPLQGLTTRTTSDFSIALLDGWATVGDVLTFYQERIANEGFLRTATERRSVLELSRLIGYTLRPGVAATAYLAYTLDDNQQDPVTITTGARSQSVPGPDEQPQYFETSEDLLARREWNNLQVRLTRPANITQATALMVEQIFVAGTTTNLKKGDKLLLVFADDGTESVLRTVVSTDTQFADQRTGISLQPVNLFFAACVQLLMACLAKLPAVGASGTGTPEGRSTLEAQAILEDSFLGVISNPLIWVKRIDDAADEPLPTLFDQAFNQLETDIANLAKAGGVPVPGITSPDDFVKPLLQPAVPQVANSLQLTRTLAKAFQLGADVSPQLLLTLAQPLRDTYYSAWAGAQLNSAQAPLKQLYVLRTNAALFGATASKLPVYFTGQNTGEPPPGTLKPQNLWDEWDYQSDEANDNAFVDQAIDAIVPGSYVVAINPQGDAFMPHRHVMRVKDAVTLPRSAYGLSGKTTALTFNVDWRTTFANESPLKIDDLRVTQIYAQSEPLTILETPIAAPVEAQEIQLSRLYDGLTSGRWVILSGERADIDNVAGVTVSELQMISGLRQGFNQNLPGDQVHTTLQLSTPLAYKYKRDTLVIYGNVVKATHGATNNELLGSGTAQSFQSFTLKQPPLTFVAAPTAAGADSTLHVFVNNVEWHETDSLAGLGPKDQKFITLTDDAGNTALTFGDGTSGARLPTGVQNVTSVYRTGIGAGGNVRAEQISLLQTRPLGVKAVINPLRASGGADKESRDLARENAPLSVTSLDRLVSIQDYSDFTRRFAGIAKAIAVRTSDGLRQLLYLTIAGADDIPIDTSSDLYRNLLAALVGLGDPDLPIRVDPRELRVLVLSAKIKLLADYRWEPVASAIRERLLDGFGFGERQLGQWALLSEVISVMQNVTGVAYVDVDTFGAIPEKTTDPNGTRRLLTQSEISEQVQDLVDPSRQSGKFNTVTSTPKVDQLPPNVSAWPGGPDGGVLRPAELVIFVPTVADTLILNQIL